MSGSNSNSRLKGVSICASSRASKIRRWVSPVKTRLLPDTRNRDRFGNSTFSETPNTRSANREDVKNESITELPRGSRTLSHNSTLEPPRSAANRRLRHSSSSLVGGSTATSPPVASAPMHFASKVLPVPAAGASKPVAGQVGRAGRKHAANMAARVTPTATSSAKGNKRIGCHSLASASKACSTVGADGTASG